MILLARSTAGGFQAPSAAAPDDSWQEDCTALFVQEGRMKPVAIVGVILILIGIVALAYGGFSFTTTEKVAEIGPLKLEKERTNSVNLPPILGALALAGGVVLLVAGARSR
jgi:hypothetical protein